MHAESNVDYPLAPTPRVLNAEITRTWCELGGNQECEDVPGYAVRGEREPIRDPPRGDSSLAP